MNIFRNNKSVIPYTVNKAITSNCYISIDSGEVVVNAPWYFSKRQIQSIIEEKRQWILEKMKEYQKQNNIYMDKGTISVLGATRQVCLYYKNVKTPTINLVNRNIEVILPNQYKKMETTQILKILVEKLYDKIAEQEIENAMEKARLALGIAPEDYEIKRMENNTIGRYITDEKKIVINPDIAMFDRNIIDYVVLHEFCHLKYKIHTKNFWKMIEKQMPSYQKYETILKGSSF